MPKTSQEIVQNLLKEAKYYWYDKNEDNVQTINLDDFDPIVDKLFKANALELEKLYGELDESQETIILELAKALIPDESLLPEPGYTVAQITPKAARLNIAPDNSFQITGQSDTGEKHEYYFTPLFEHSYPKCEIAVLLTETLKQIDNQQEEQRITSSDKMTSYIWLGLDIDKTEEADSIPFFLGNSIVEEFDKNHYIFHQAKWLLNGQTELNTKSGIASFGVEKKSQLLDDLDIPNSYEKQIFNRLKNSFVLLNLPDNLAALKSTTPPFSQNGQSTANLKIKNPLCWIKVEFTFAIPVDFLLESPLYPNCIPLVNRRLIDKYVVKNNYDRILLPMPTKDLFLEVHKIFDAIDEEEDTAYQRVDLLNTNSEACSYMLRSGARVRRFNQADASQQIRRLLEVIQDEYSTFKEQGVNRLKEDFEIIDNALERIRRQLPDYFRSSSNNIPYFAIANFRPGINRLNYQYWETQGNTIKHLGDKLNLQVNSNDIKIADSQSVIPIQRGKDELSKDDYINQLKISILSRGRIVTKGDIQLYCKSQYGQLLTIASISRQLMPLEDGNLGRGILVKVNPIKALSPTKAKFITTELQNDLNAKSAFFTYIKVAINEA